MTTKQELQKKLDELQELKGNLLRIEPFLDSNNNSFVYSSEDIEDLAGTQGTTPANLSEILEEVVKKINEYVDYIKTLPYAESSAIYRERPEVDLALVSKNRAGFHPPVSWTEKALEASVDSIYGYLAMSEYYGAVRKIKVYASPTIRKGDSSGRDIDIETKLFRINSRLNVNSEFRSGSGALDVTLTDDVLAPDDIYIVGLVVKEAMANDIIYYQDLTYSIEYEFMDGTTSKEMYTMGNRRIGNMLPDIDSTLSYGCVYWDMLTISRFTIDVSNSVGDTSEINTFVDGPISGGLFDGNIVTEFKTSMFATNMASRKLSYRSGCSWFRSMLNDKYDLYDKNTSEVIGVVFNNLRPIDRIIEEAINAL